MGASDLYFPTFQGELETLVYLRATVVINPVDLASDEDADLAVLPALLIGQQVRDQQGQTWQGTSDEATRQPRGQSTGMDSCPQDGNERTTTCEHV